MTNRSVLVRLGMDVQNYLSAADQAAGANKKIGDTGTQAVDAVGQSFDVLGAVKTVAATVAVGLFAKTAVDKASEAEQAQLRLNFAYQQFPALADVSLQSLKDLATQQEKTTTFDHVATQQAEALLAMYNLTGQQIKDLIPLAQDYAAATGQDLPTAADILGKALLGSGRALKAVGIDFKDTGTTAGNLNELMTQLQAKVGGFAVAEKNTAAGAGKTLRNEFTAMQQTIGGELVPALELADRGLSDVIGWLNSLPGPVKNTIIAISSLAGGTLYLVPRLASLWANLEQAGLVGKNAAVGLQATAAAETEVAVAGDAAVASTLRLTGGINRVSSAAATIAKASLPVTLLAGAFGILTYADDRFNESMGRTVKAGPDAAKVVDSLGASGNLTSDALVKLGASGASLGDMLGQVFNRSAWDNFQAVGNKVTDKLFHTQDAVEQAQTAFASLDNGLAQMLANGNATQAAAVFKQVSDAAKAQGIDVKQLADVFPSYTTALDAWTRAGGAVKTTQDQAAASLASYRTGTLSAQSAAQQFTGSTAEQTAALKILVDEINKTTDTVDSLAHSELAARQAQSDEKDAVDKSNAALKAYTDAVRKHGKASKEARAAQHDYNQSLRDAESAMLTVADDARALATAQATQAGSSNAAGVGNEAYRKSLVNMEKGLKPGSPLRVYLQGLIDQLDNAAKPRHGSFTEQVSIGVSQKGSGGEFHGGHDAGVAAATAAAVASTFHPAGKTGSGKAAGGLAIGPGSGTSDSFQIPVSNGEWVIQKSAVDTYGQDFMRAVNTGSYQPVGSAADIAQLTAVAANLARAAADLDRLERPRVFLDSREITRGVDGRHLADARR